MGQDKLVSTPRAFGCLGWPIFLLHLLVEFFTSYIKELSDWERRSLFCLSINSICGYANANVLAGHGRMPTRIQRVNLSDALWKTMPDLLMLHFREVANS